MLRPGELLEGVTSFPDNFSLSAPLYKAEKAVFECMQNNVAFNHTHEKGVYHLQNITKGKLIIAHIEMY